MSLTIVTSGNRVDHGSATSLDNLNPFTLWAWVERTGNGANQMIVSKDSAFPSGVNFLVDDAPGEGSLRLFRPRATTTTDFISTAGAVPLNVPMFVACTFDSTRATTGALYTGRPGRNVAEVAYSTATNGAGALNDDAASLLWVGNLQRNTAITFKGRIGWYGVLNRWLTLGEAQQIYTAPTIHHALLPGTVLLSGWQDTTATQIDLSGYGNHGTVTGATVHAPLPSRLARLPIVGRRSAAGAATAARARFYPLLGAA